MGINWDKGIGKGSGDTYTKLGLYVDLADRRSATLFFAFGPKVRGSLLVLPLVLTGLYQKDTTITDTCVSYPLTVTRRDPHGCDA